MDDQNIAYKSWWRRNLIWLFPLLLVLITGIYLILSGVIGMGDYAKAYADMPLFENAQQQAQQNQRVAEVLGELEPINKMTIAEGAVEYAEDGNAINSTITVKGSKGKGKMDIAAVKANGAWLYKRIAVRVKQPAETITVLSAD